MDKRSVVGLAVLVLGSLMLGGIPADAQTPSTFPRTSFEVAAVKVNVTGDSQRPSVWFGLGGRFTARNVTLRTLIEDAYHIMPGKGYVKGGAAWLDTMRFDIDAKAPDEVIDRVRQQLTGLLDLQGCRFEYGVLLGHPPRREADGTVVTKHGRWNVDEAGLLGEAIELRVFGGGQYYGRFMMRATSGSWPSLQARLVAVTLADQAGRALAAGTPAASGR